MLKQLLVGDMCIFVCLHEGKIANLFQLDAASGIFHKTGIGRSGIHDNGHDRLWFGKGSLCKIFSANFAG
jgi:hypothetical protein